MNRFTKVLVILLPFLLCGCLEVSQKIIVNKDGGGRIIEKFMMSKQALKMISGFFNALPTAMGSKPSKQEALNLYDKKKLMADAEKYGPGVKYLSSKMLSTDTKEGYEAEYEFKDITKLRINQNPSGKAPKPSDATSTAKEENITFLFEKGKPAVLTVLFPGRTDFTKEKKNKGDKRDKTTKEKATDEMREALKDLYIGITVQPEGKIVETDATYNDGGTITLLEMDFKQLLSDDEQFKSFAKADPESVEEAKALLKKIPGFKVEMKDRVTVKFE